MYCSASATLATTSAWRMAAMGRSFGRRCSLPSCQYVIGRRAGRVGPPIWSRCARFGRLTSSLVGRFQPAAHRKPVQTESQPAVPAEESMASIESVVHEKRLFPASAEWQRTANVKPDDLEVL